MKSKSLLILFCFTQFYVVTSFAQSDFRYFVDNYTYFKNISVKDGLSSDFVLNIFQSTDGVVWLATDNGLTRYDGNFFTIYKHSKDTVNSLSDNFITAITEDVEKNLWIATKNGLNKYNRDKNSFKRYFFDNQQKNNIKAIYADKDGYLWLMSGGGYIIRYDIRKNTYTTHKIHQHKSEGDYYYYQIFEDSKHNLWFGGRNETPTVLWNKNINNIEYLNYENTDFTEASGYVENMNGDFFWINYPDLSLAKFNSATKKGKTVLKLDFPVSFGICDNSNNFWLAGSSGLMKIDFATKYITLIKHIYENPTSIASNNVNCIYKDRQNRIWLGSDKGISLYSEKLNIFRHYKQIYGQKNTLVSNNITALMQDKDGLLWVGTAENGVDTFSLTHEIFGNITYNLLSQNLDNETHKREKEVLRQYSLHNFRKSKNENNVSALYQDKDGKIYIGLWSHVGFNVFDKKTKTMKRYALWGKSANNSYPRQFEGNPFGANWYADFLEDNAGNFWIATWEALGLNLFDRKTGKFLSQHFMPGDNPKKTSVKLIFDSLRNRMYIGGGHYYGYYNLNEKYFVRYAAKIPHNYPNKEIWEGYYKFCKAKFIDIPVNFVCQNYIFQDSVIFIETDEGTFKHNLNTDIFVATNTVAKNALLPRHLPQLYAKDNNFNIWTSTDNGILVYNEKTQTTTNLSEPDSTTLASRLLNCLMLDHNGNIWCGTTDNGISIISENFFTPTIRHLSTSNGLSDNYINCIFETSKQKIYICTNKGLDVVKPDISLFPKNIISDINVMKILEDADNNLWLSTNNGLYCIDSYDSIIRHIINFPGLSDKNFSKAGCKLQNEKLCFGGNYGFISFNPKLLLSDIKAINPIFSQFYIKNELYHFDFNNIKKINLKHNENSFSLSFVSPNYGFETLIKYRYKLEGFDKNWTYAELPALTAKYANIPSGKYIFVVEATNCSGEWKNGTTELLINIATPWYLQTWFFILTAISLIFLLIFIIKFRERNLRKVNLNLEKIVEKRTVELKNTNSQLQESEKKLQAMVDSKNKFFSIISHDLRNPVKSLTQTSNILHQNFANLNDTDKQNLIKLIFEASEQTETMLENLLLWALSQREVLKVALNPQNLYNAVEETRDFLKLLAGKKQITIKNEIATNTTVFADKNQLSTILRNLIGNAIHYSYPDSQIIVSAKKLETHENMLEISIKDFGMGISEENLKNLFSISRKISTKGTNGEKGNGLGLILVHEFVKMNGGSIRVETVVGKGTEFFVIFKINDENI